jgi:hypothetical protein
MVAMYFSKGSVLLLFFLLFLLFSCNDKDKKLEKQGFKVLKSLKMVSDSTTSQNFTVSQKINDKLFILNQKNRTIDVYHFKDGGGLHKKIVLKKEGVNGVGVINDFLVHTQDSIFLLNCYNYKVFLINQEGEIITKYNLLKHKIGNQTAMPDPFPWHKMCLIDKKLYISSVPDSSPFQKDYYKREQNLIVLDIESHAFEVKLGFPDIYRQKIYPYALSSFSRAYSDKKKVFFYSFFADENIVVFDHEHKRKKSYLANSKYLEKVESLKKELLDEAANNIAANQISFFNSIHYNPHKDILYRFFSLKIPDKDKSISKTGVIILDKDFNIIGDFLIDDKLIYNTLQPFFTPEGIWIQRLTDNEDELVYDLIDFVGE